MPESADKLMHQLVEKPETATPVLPNVSAVEKFMGQYGTERRIMTFRCTVEGQERKEKGITGPPSDYRKVHSQVELSRAGCGCMLTCVCESRE